MRRLFRAGAGLIAGLAAACGQQPTTVVNYMHPSGTWDFLVGAVRTGAPMPVEVHGRPFPVAPEDLALAVTEAMERAITVRKVPFAAAPAPLPEDARHGFRVILLLGAPKDANASAVCAGRVPEPVAPPAEHPERLEVRAVFCGGDTLFADVRGRLDGARDPFGKPFQDLIGQIAREMFPPDRGR